MILASHARRDIDYTCPECSGLVRCRGGQRRQTHFYHIRRPASCRQHGKSLAHLQIQLHLKSLIPSLEIEKRLQGRIADALWEKEKIIFEVQCSPMPVEEAQSRTKDYKAQGYTVVWILHDRRYNRKNIPPVETFLRKETTTFFTNGRYFYDQFEVCINGKRFFRGPPLTVDLARPNKQKSSLFFEGDLTHWSLHHDTSHLRKIAQRYRRHRFWHGLKRAYRFFIYRLLESSSR